MNLKPDDFEKGMLVIHTGDNCELVTQIFRIVGIQLPFVVLERVWNDPQFGIGHRKMVDIRQNSFTRCSKEILEAVGYEA